MASEGEEVKLLGAWASPFVLRVQIALNLKGVGYEFLQEVVGKKSELLLKSNPVYKKFPVLIHKGKPICESMVIVQYIDQVWGAAAGHSILPSDPYDCATAHFWVTYIDDKLPSSLRTIAGLIEGSKSEAAEQAAAAFQQLEEAFERCSKGKGFFNGEAIGYVDIALGSYLGWIKAIEKLTGNKFLDETKTPLLVGWADRFCSDNAVKEVMPEVDKLLEFVRMIVSRIKAAHAQ